jgi:hypothetical protein
MCASARVIKSFLIYGQIHLTFAVNILHITTNSMSCVRLMFTHCVHACERACARVRVIKCSLIYGRIFFKFAGNILHITTSSMGF